MGEQRRILIIGDEGLFVEALGKLSPTEYAVLHAADVDEAREACAEGALTAVVAVANGEGPLTSLLDELREGGALRVGLLGGAERAGASESFDQLIDEEDPGAAMDEVARLLRERAPPPRRSWTDEARRVVQQPLAEGTRSAQLTALTRQLEEARARRLQPHEQALAQLREAQEEISRQQTFYEQQLEQLQRALDEERAARVSALEALAARQEQSEKTAAVHRARIESLVDDVEASRTRLDGYTTALRKASAELEELRAAPTAGFSEGEAGATPVARRVGRGVTAEIERLIAADGSGADGRKEDSVVAEVSFSSETASFVRESSRAESTWSKSGEVSTVEPASHETDDGPTITDPPPASRGIPVRVRADDLIVDEETVDAPVAAGRSAITAEETVAGPQLAKPKPPADGEPGSMKLTAPRWPYWAAAGVGLLALGVGVLLLLWDGEPAAVAIDAMVYGPLDAGPAGAEAADAAPPAPPRRTADAASVGRSAGAADARPRPSRRAIPPRARHLISARKLLRSGQHVAAREQLTAALKLADDHRVRQLLAETHERAGERWAAAHHLQKAIPLAPQAARAALHERLGRTYVLLGKRTRACTSFRAALREDPEHAGAKIHVTQHCAR